VTVRRVVIALVALDASNRGTDPLIEEEPEPAEGGTEAVAEALDDAARVSAALASIDDGYALLRAVFDALNDTEVRLLVFERALRAMVERRRRT
jgi:hypothetical protein